MSREVITIKKAIDSFLLSCKVEGKSNGTMYPDCRKRHSNVLLPYQIKLSWGQEGTWILKSRPLNSMAD